MPNASEEHRRATVSQTRGTARAPHTWQCANFFGSQVALLNAQGGRIHRSEPPHGRSPFRNCAFALLGPPQERTSPPRVRPCRRKKTPTMAWALHCYPLGGSKRLVSRTSESKTQCVGSRFPHYPRWGIQTVGFSHIGIQQTPMRLKPLFSLPPRGDPNFPKPRRQHRSAPSRGQGKSDDFSI